MTAGTIYTYLDVDSAAPRHLKQTDVTVMGLIVNLINNNNDIRQYKMYSKAREWMEKNEEDFYLYFIRSRGTGHNHTQTVWEFTEFYLDGPFPLVGRGLLHQGLPWFPLWHLPGERQLTLRLQTEHTPFECHVFFHVKISPDTKTINATVPFLKRNNIHFFFNTPACNGFFPWPLFEASE